MDLSRDEVRRMLEEEGGGGGEGRGGGGDWKTAWVGSYVCSLLSAKNDTGSKEPTNNVTGNDYMVL